MKFFEFLQNNSGGFFKVDDKVCGQVIIEAENVSEAIDIAEDLGIYFDGCSIGKDCSCCGDRWSEPWSEDGMSLEQLNLIINKENNYRRTDPNTRIFYKDGTVKEIFANAF